MPSYLEFWNLDSNKQLRIILKLNSKVRLGRQNGMFPQDYLLIEIAELFSYKLFKYGVKGVNREPCEANVNSSTNALTFYINIVLKQYRVCGIPSNTSKSRMFPYVAIHHCITATFRCARILIITILHKFTQVGINGGQKKILKFVHIHSLSCSCKSYQLTKRFQFQHRTQKVLVLL